MDLKQADLSTDTHSKTALLLANIESALRSLHDERVQMDAQTSLGTLELALHTYGSIKHLLPKLDLTANQRAPVEEQLQRLRKRILDHSNVPRRF